MLDGRKGCTCAQGKLRGWSPQGVAVLCTAMSNTWIYTFSPRKRGQHVYKQYGGTQCRDSWKQPTDGAVTAVHNRWLSMNCFLKTQWALTVGSTNIQLVNQHHLMWTVNRAHCWALWGPASKVVFPIPAWAQQTFWIGIS